MRKGSSEGVWKAGEVGGNQKQGVFLKSERRMFQAVFIHRWIKGVWKLYWGITKTLAPPSNPYGGGKWITSTWETAEVVASSRENHVLIKARWYTFRESEKREGVPLLQKGFPEDIAVSLEKMPREACRCVYRTVVCLEWPIHCATGFLTYQQDKSTMSLHDDNIQTYMW